MGVSMSELLILLIIAVVLFGSRRLKDLGTDLGSAITGFRKAMKDSGTVKNDPDNNDANRKDETPSRHHNNN